jgi:hypothetical protein
MKMDELKKAIAENTDLGKLGALHELCESLKIESNFNQECTKELIPEKEWLADVRLVIQQMNHRRMMLLIVTIGQNYVKGGPVSAAWMDELERRIQQQHHTDFDLSEAWTES